MTALSGTQQQLYPVYLVHDKNSGYETERAGSFKLSDPLFRSRSFILQAADHPIDFLAYTEHNRLTIDIRYAALSEQESGDLVLLFDPDRSRRKAHNAFRFRIGEDGGLKYEQYRYELEVADVPDGVAYDHQVDGGFHQVRLSLPFALLRLEPVFNRLIAFNAIRTIRRGKQEMAAVWAGIKGDKSAAGQGTGDLLMTRGLAPEEIAEWQLKTASESAVYFTRWEKKKVPEELYAYMTAKRRGLTVRLDRNDAERARDRAERTPWGRGMKEAILKIADYWAAKSDDELFDLIPVGNPRAITPSVHFGDPLTGGDRNAHQACLEKPYQWYAPESGMWWHNGVPFRNPTTGEELVLQDNGEGFVAPEGLPHPGVRYMFTASYRLFILSMLLGSPRCEVLDDRSVCPDASGLEYAGAISNLAYAYQLTLDRKYAYKALIIAGRIAELLPYMNGWYGSGYYDTVQIAEPTTSESHWLSNYFDALDLVYDTVDDLEPELQSFFARKPDAEHNPRTQPFDVKAVVHEMIPHVLFSCEIEKTRSADWSFRWIYLELIVASFLESGKLMHRVLREGKHSLRSKMRNLFFRDGKYSYDSMFYLEIICEQMTLMANNNFRFRDDTYFPEGIDMFEDPEYGLTSVISLFARLKSGNLTPSFGDVKGIGNPEPIPVNRSKGKFAYSPAFEITFARMKSLRDVLGPVLAQFDPDELEDYRIGSASFSLHRTDKKQQRFGLLLLATAAEWDDYQEYRSKESDIQPSFLLEDSEISIFRAGTNHHNCKHVILYGAPSAGHMHGDKLGLWIGAYGYHLLGGVGDYPNSWVSAKYPVWEAHSAACTIVVVDGKDQEVSFSRLKCHYEGDWLQLSGMDNTTAYPGTHDERWCCVIKAPDGEDAYVVDLNYLAVGRTFDYNTIGIDIPFEQVQFEGIAERDWIPMSGTLAGEDVPLYCEPGYGWMKAWRRAPVDRPVSWTFQYSGAALKIHTVPAGGTRELICCLGEKGGTEKGKSPWLPFVLWRDATDDPDHHTASFVTVLEPFEHAPFLRSVKPMELIGGMNSSKFTSAGLEIDYADGHRDIVISVYGEGDFISYRDSHGRVYETDARLLLLRYQHNRLTKVEAVQYTRIFTEAYRSERQSPSFTGRVSAVDIDSRTIEVTCDSPYDDFPLSLERQVALIDSPDYEKPSTYYMFDPVIEGERFRFRADMTLIKLDSDNWASAPKRRGLGNKNIVMDGESPVYVDVKPGDTFTILNSIRVSFP